MLALIMFIYVTWMTYCISQPAHQKYSTGKTNLRWLLTMPRLELQFLSVRPSLLFMPHRLNIWRAWGSSCIFPCEPLSPEFQESSVGVRLNGCFSLACTQILTSHCSTQAIDRGWKVMATWSRNYDNTLCKSSRLWLLRGEFTSWVTPVVRFRLHEHFCNVSH